MKRIRCYLTGKSHEMQFISVKHSINGRSLGLPKALPVNVYINGALAIPGFEYGDKVQTKLSGHLHDHSRVGRWHAITQHDHWARLCGRWRRPDLQR